jgi:hypothetical protein
MEGLEPFQNHSGNKWAPYQEIISLGNCRKLPYWALHTYLGNCWYKSTLETTQELVMGTINSSDRMAATLYSLGTWIGTHVAYFVIGARERSPGTKLASRGVTNSQTAPSWRMRVGAPSPDVSSWCGVLLSTGIICLHYLLILLASNQGWLGGSGMCWKPVLLNSII